MFSVKKETLQEGAVRMKPGIHDNVVITAVEPKNTEPKEEGGKSYSVIDITFKNQASEVFTHRIFDPTNPEDLEKQTKGAENAAFYISYIASKTQGTEILVENIESFEQLGKFAVAKIKTKVPLKLKLLGSVYDSRARLQVPPYGGWLQSMASGKSLQLSKKEILGNQDWESHMAAQVPSGDSQPVEGGGTDPDDLPF